MLATKSGFQICYPRTRNPIFKQKFCPSVCNHNKKIHTKFNLENKSVLPNFTYSRLEIKEPTWGLPTTRKNLSLTDRLKEKTPTRANLKRFKEVVENKYKGWKNIYTDGSVQNLHHHQSLAPYSQQKHIQYT